MTDISLLDTRSQQHIENDAGNQVRKVHRLHSDQSDHASESGVRYDSQYSDTGEGKGTYLPGCMTLDERPLGGTDHMDDQGLAPHGLNEPSGLEEGCVLLLHGSKRISAVIIGQLVVPVPAA